MSENSGKLNSAVYSRPHLMEDGSLAFIMRDRLTHHNLQSNPHAAFLFIQDGPGYIGKRLNLKLLREEQNPDLIKKIRRRRFADDKQEPTFLVYFSLERQLPLIGGGPE